MRAYEIIVQNLKSVPILIKIYEQIPISIIKDVSILYNNPDSSRINEEEGIFTWERNIEAKGLATLHFDYSVKYPKHERIILE